MTEPTVAPPWVGADREPLLALRDIVPPAAGSARSSSRRAGLSERELVRWST